MGRTCRAHGIVLSTFSSSQLLPALNSLKSHLFLFHCSLEKNMNPYRHASEASDIYREGMKEGELAYGGEDFSDDDGDNLFSIGSLAAGKLEQLQLQHADDYGFEAGLNFPLEKVKHISVDPASLGRLAKVNGQFLSSHSPSSGTVIQQLPHKSKFISASLPCSTSSSPRFDSVSLKSMVLHTLARQQSTTLPRPILRQGANFRRSKSCGEGRSCLPPDEFDIMSKRFSIHQPVNQVQILYECRDDRSESIKDQEAEVPLGEENVKCGALCLFLPGFSKKKRMPAIKIVGEDQGGMVSRAASLEKFECGSWSSAAILDGDEREESVRSYFDLPLELINSSSNDANSPVTAAFVFEKDRKGVLKKSSSKSTAPRKSHESSIRHVRFSTSSPTSYPPSPTSTCITPRLLKAREEFNAFLEAQGV